MIVDITNEILTDIKAALPEITVLSPHQFVTPNFPTIIIEELENTDDVSTKDSSGFVYANVSYSIEIYTVGSTRISEAKKIRNQINRIISEKYGLARKMSRSLPNYLDGDVYRYQLTYSGKISMTKTIYRG